MAPRNEQTAISISRYLRDGLRTLKEKGDSWDTIIIGLVEKAKRLEKYEQPKSI